MSFRIQPMDREHAEFIAGWAYPPPYDFYNLEHSTSAIQEMMEGAYYTIHTEENDLLGFFCLGKSAQVPVGHQFGAYQMNQTTIDIGVGMRPELTGKGFGYEFFSIVLDYVTKTYPRMVLRLTVAACNQRAIRLYENCGFVRGMSFPGNTSGFITMFFAATSFSCN